MAEKPDSYPDMKTADADVLAKQEKLNDSKAEVEELLKVEDAKKRAYEDTKAATGSDRKYNHDLAIKGAKSEHETAEKNRQHAVVRSQKAQGDVNVAEDNRSRTRQRLKGKELEKQRRKEEQERVRDSEAKDKTLGSKYEPGRQQAIGALCQECPKKPCDVTELKIVITAPPLDKEEPHKFVLSTDTILRGSSSGLVARWEAIRKKDKEKKAEEDKKLAAAKAKKAAADAKQAAADKKAGKKSKKLTPKEKREKKAKEKREADQKAYEKFAKEAARYNREKEIEGLLGRYDLIIDTIAPMIPLEDFSNLGKSGLPADSSSEASKDAQGKEKKSVELQVFAKYLDATCAIKRHPRVEFRSYNEVPPLLLKVTNLVVKKINKVSKSVEAITGYETGVHLESDTGIINQAVLGDTKDTNQEWTVDGSNSISTKDFSKYILDDEGNAKYDDGAIHLYGPLLWFAASKTGYKTVDKVAAKVPKYLKDPLAELPGPFAIVEGIFKSQSARCFEIAATGCGNRPKGGGDPNLSLLALVRVYPQSKWEIEISMPAWFTRSKTNEYKKTSSTDVTGKTLTSEAYSSEEVKGGKTTKTKQSKETNSANNTETMTDETTTENATTGEKTSSKTVDVKSKTPGGNVQQTSTSTNQTTAGTGTEVSVTSSTLNRNYEDQTPLTMDAGIPNRDINSDSFSNDEIGERELYNDAEVTQTGIPQVARTEAEQLKKDEAKKKFSVSIKHNGQDLLDNDLVKKTLESVNKIVDAIKHFQKEWLEASKSVGMSLTQQISAFAGTITIEMGPKYIDGPIAKGRYYPVDPWACEGKINVTILDWSVEGKIGIELTKRKWKFELTGTLKMSITVKAEAPLEMSYFETNARPATVALAVDQDTSIKATLLAKRDRKVLCDGEIEASTGIAFETKLRVKFDGDAPMFGLEKGQLKTKGILIKGKLKGPFGIDGKIDPPVKVVRPATVDLYD